MVRIMRGVTHAGHYSEAGEIERRGRGGAASGHSRCKCPEARTYLGASRDSKELVGWRPVNNGREQMEEEEMGHAEPWGPRGAG